MHCGLPNQNFGRAMAHPAHAAAPPCNPIPIHNPIPDPDQYTMLMTTISLTRSRPVIAIRRIEIPLVEIRRNERTPPQHRYTLVMQATVHGNMHYGSHSCPNSSHPHIVVGLVVQQ